MRNEGDHHSFYDRLRNGIREIVRKEGDEVMEQIQSRGGEEPLINIVGEKVALGPLHKDVLPILNKWENDFEVTFFSGDPMRPVVLEETATRYARESKGEQRYQIQF